MNVHNLNVLHTKSSDWHERFITGPEVGTSSFLKLVRPDSRTQKTNAGNMRLPLGSQASSCGDCRWRNSSTPVVPWYMILGDSTGEIKGR